MALIRLSPDCGIRYVRELYEEALAASRSGGEVDLDCGAIRRIDCSVAQVLLALRIDCEERGATFTVRKASEDTARLLRLAGL